jgi:hypothetical protein
VYETTWGRGRCVYVVCVCVCVVNWCVCVWCVCARVRVRVSEGLNPVFRCVYVVCLSVCVLGGGHACVPSIRLDPRIEGHNPDIIGSCSGRWMAHPAAVGGLTILSAAAAMLLSR